MQKTAILILVTLAMAGCGSKETRLQSFLLKGNTSLDEGDADKALYYYNEALKVDPCFTEALNNSGTINHKSGNYDEAVARYTKAIECNPGFLDAWFNRANSYYESGEYFSALSDIDHIAKTKGDTSAVYFLKGLVLTKQRDYPAALTAFQRALELGPADESAARVNLASVKIFMKRYDEAKTELEACIKLAPQESNIYNSLALIAIEKKDFNEALKQVNKAIELSPKQPYFINNRGFIYINLDKLTEAENDINESITIDPYNAWAYRNKGVLYLKKKDYDVAERLLTKAKQMDSDVENVDEYLSQIPEKKLR
ncbi:MAG TPA: tetratricopeptide repeat protein [Cyclobacteriaceae bacterium]|nr:tetratricopeptide repeat protein [Cyclobacteriaceae bacterium]